MTDEEVKRHLSEIKDDSREIFLAGGGNVRVTAVSATRMATEATLNHRLDPLESYAMSEAYVAASLLSSEVKGNDRIRLEIESDGAIDAVSVEAWACGAVRGYLRGNGEKKAKLSSLSRPSLYGNGFLTVEKMLEGSKSPFSGKVELEGESLAESLAYYYLKSQETPSAFAISVKMDDKGRIRGAGGLFAQALPGASDEDKERIETVFGSLPSLGDYIASGGSIRDYARNAFGENDSLFLSHSPIGFSCPCSKKSFGEYLRSLPEDEKKAMLVGEFPLSLECFNCGSIYEFSLIEVEDLFKEVR